MKGILKLLCAIWIAVLFSVSNPASTLLDPILKGSWPGYSPNVTGLNIAILNNRAYVATNPQINFILDVTNPQAPRVLSAADSAADPYSALFASGLLELEWPYAYFSTDYWADGLGLTVKIVDISDASHPTLAAFVDAGLVYSASVSAGKLYTARHEWSFDSGFGIYYSGGNFFIHDVTDHAHPKWLSGSGNGPIPSYEHRFSRDYYGSGAEGNLFATQNAGVLHLDDFSTGAVQIRARIPAKGPVTHTKISAGILYCLGGGFLSVIDIHNPVNPRITAEIPLDSTPNSLWIDRGFAYVGSSSNIASFDVRNPSSPQLTARFDFRRGEAKAVAATGPFVFSAEGTNGLQLVDFSDTKNPKVLKGIQSGNYIAIKISGSRAYALDSTALKILDISL